MTTDKPMVRAALATDREAVVALAASSGLFPPEGAEEVVATFDRSANGSDPDALWSVITTGGDVVGVSYLGPEQMANGTWNLFFLAVDSERRNSGLGGSLVAAAEIAVRDRGGRVLLIETSGQDGFDRQRAFYARLGYTLEARIRDYYDHGDDKVVFWKDMAGE
ncbi:MAG: GNAT family N-acetyltransferase [Mycobacteriales bacterium]